MANYDLVLRCQEGTIMGRSFGKVDSHFIHTLCCYVNLVQIGCADCIQIVHKRKIPFYEGYYHGMRVAKYLCVDEDSRGIGFTLDYRTVEQIKEFGNAHGFKNSSTKRRWFEIATGEEVEIEFQ